MTELGIDSLSKCSRAYSVPQGRRWLTFRADVSATEALWNLHLQLVRDAAHTDGLCDVAYLGDLSKLCSMAACCRELRHIPIHGSPTGMRELRYIAILSTGIFQLQYF